MANFTGEPLLSDRFADALQFAFWQHNRQIRKDNVPYFSHLMAVSGLVLEAGGTEEEAVAALLHDLLEDIGLIDSRVMPIGSKAWHIVVSLTERRDLPPAERKRFYAQSVALGSHSVKLISCADKLHNLRSYATDGRSLWKPETAEFYALLMPTYEGCDRIPRHWVEEMKNLLSKLSTEDVTSAS